MGNSFNQSFKSKKLKKLEPNSTFHFSCKHCGRCCIDRVGPDSIILNPYDIFRIAKHLGESTKDIIKDYTEIILGTDSKLPLAIATSYMEGDTVICRFQSEGSCTIQDFKPSVCSLYPLGRMIRVDNESNNLDIEYFVQPTECKGSIRMPHDTHTLDNWLPNREESEQAFLKLSAFVKKYCETVTPKILADNKISDNFKDLLVSVVVDSLYMNYDTDGDFLEQFDKNTDRWLQLQVEINDMYNKLKTGDLRYNESKVDCEVPKNKHGWR